MISPTQTAGRVGLLPVMDPRIEPELQAKLLGQLQLAEKPARPRDRRGLAGPSGDNGRGCRRTSRQDACGRRVRHHLLHRLVLRANVIVVAARRSHLPSSVVRGYD